MSDFIIYKSGLDFLSNNHCRINFVWILNKQVTFLDKFP